MARPGFASHKRARPCLSRSGESRSGPSKKTVGWGGARAGAGRPKGSGQGPSPNARQNRIAIMLTDAEWKKLIRIAKRRKMPPATLAYRFLAAGMRQTR